ncbi:Inhibitor of growth protein [Aphelenchoides avenae]|nr:Inhibitor of growth protein [Aphelenchus avenae]
MRELDERVEKLNAQIRQDSRELFDKYDELSAEDRQGRYIKLKEDYATVKEWSAEKVAIAEFIQNMLEKFVERVSKDLQRFKEELESDSPGITESVEKQFEENERSVIANRRERLTSIGTLSAFDGFSPTGSHGMDDDYEDDMYDDGPAAPPAAPPRSSGAVAPRMNGHRNNVGSAAPNDEVPSKEEILRDILAAEARILGGADQQRAQTSATAMRQRVTSTDSDYGPPPTKARFRTGPLGTFRLISEHKQRPPMQQRSMDTYPFDAGLGGSGASPRTQSPSQSYPSGRYTLPSDVGGAARHRPIAAGSHSMASPPQSALSGPVMQQAGAPGTSATAAALNMPNFAATRESMHGRPRKLTPKIQQMLQPGTGNRVGRPPGSTSSASLHQPGGATMASAVGASTQNPFVPGGASYAHAPQKMTVRLGAMSMPGPHGGMTGPMGMLMEGGAAGGGPMDEEEEGADTDDRTYCTCGQKSYGEM